MLARTNRLARRPGRRSAFTLMEVLVVVAILVVLAGVGGVIYMRVQEDAYRDIARTQIGQIETAVRSYMRSHGDQPPPSLQELVAPSDGSRGYLEQDKITDPWGMPYNFNPASFTGKNAARNVPDISSSGPDRQAGTQDDIGNWQ